MERFCGLCRRHPFWVFFVIMICFLFEQAAGL